MNDSGVAVGARSGVPATWAPDGNNGYVATDIDLLPDQQFGIAEDINNDGIVVGYDFVGGGFPLPLAFLRLANGTVIELDPAQGDLHSRAHAVSDVFTDSDDGFVFVAGTTIDVNGVERGIRWTINVDTGVVVALTVLNMQFATGVNDAGDVAGASLSTRPPSQSATLWRSGTYITLEPPKNGGNSACFGLARSAAAPIYATGTTIMRKRTGVLVQAVLWEVN